MDAISRHVNFHAKNCLLDAQPLSIDQDTIVIGFDPEFASEKDEMEVSSNRRALVQVIEKMLGREITVKLTVLPGKQVLPSDIPMPERTAANDEVGQKIKKCGRSAMTLQAREKWMKNPSVRLTLEAFNGDIIDIRV
jgi:hypothetical protein